MVFAKSYSAQLARSRHGARWCVPDGLGADVVGSLMILSVLIDGLRQATKLGDMPRRRFGLLHRADPVRFAALLPLLLWACEHSEPSVRNTAATAVAASPANRAAAQVNGGGWLVTAGPALLVQGATRDEAIALFPSSRDSDAVSRLDSVSLSGVPVVLFGRGGERFSAQLGAPTGEGTDDCERWPLHGFEPAAGTAWSVGFASDRVRPVALDSVAMLTPRDSMMLVAEVSRLASSVTAPTGPSFQGLRFTAEAVHRFEAMPGVQALVARLVRRVNQEASPQEEQTLLIAERDSGATSGPYQLAYAERAFGREEDVVTPEVLAVIRLDTSNQPLLVVAHDGNDGIAYSILERTAPRHWSVRWSSGITSCG